MNKTQVPYWVWHLKLKLSPTGFQYLGMRDQTWRSKIKDDIVSMHAPLGELIKWGNSWEILQDFLDTRMPSTGLLADRLKPNKSILWLRVSVLSRRLCTSLVFEGTCGSPCCVWTKATALAVRHFLLLVEFRMRTLSFVCSSVYWGGTSKVFR